MTVLSQSQGGAIRSFAAVRVATMSLMRWRRTRTTCGKPSGRWTWPRTTRSVRRAAGQLALAVVTLAAVTGVAVWQAKRRPYLLVGWLWFVGLLVPVIGLEGPGRRSRPGGSLHLSAPRRHFHHAGLAGGSNLARGSIAFRWVVGAGTASVLAAFALLTFIQAHYWKDSVTLWLHAWDAAPPNPIAYRSLGMALDEKGDRESALALYRAALKLDPKDEQTWFNQGLVYFALDRVPEAIDALTTSVRLNSDNAPAFYYLGVLAAKAGRAEERRWASASRHCESNPTTPAGPPAAGHDVSPDGPALGRPGTVRRP